MKGITHHLGRIFAVALASIANASALEQAVPTPPATQVIVSVADQRLALVKDGALVKKFPVSTSKFGLGDSWGSYKTPIGRHRVYEKIGDHLPSGAVMKRRHATGEILPVNAPGRDPIVTRIIWLEGLEAQNSNAKSRGIYIHGTVEEDRIGDPVSYGCIRMRSKDVTELFDEVPEGTVVDIVTGKLPRLRKWAPPKPEIILVSNERAKPAVSQRIAAAKPSRTEVVKESAKPATAEPRRVLFASNNSSKDKLPEREAWLATRGTQRSTEASMAEDPQTISSPVRKALLSRTAKRALSDDNIVDAMSASIIDSGLPNAEKEPAAAPSVADDSAPVEEPRSIRLAVSFDQETPDLLLDLLNPRPHDLPLDELSNRLLHPPVPQFRLAFRTAGSAPH